MAMLPLEDGNIGLNDDPKPVVVSSHYFPSVMGSKPGDVNIERRHKTRIITYQVLALPLKYWLKIFEVEIGDGGVKNSCEDGAGWQRPSTIQNCGGVAEAPPPDSSKLTKGPRNDARIFRSQVASLILAPSLVDAESQPPCFSCSSSNKNAPFPVKQVWDGGYKDLSRPRCNNVLLNAILLTVMIHISCSELTPSSRMVAIRRDNDGNMGWKICG
ncbi:hypothetical protein BDZ97DRAFT_1753171 [Flammula alnicola]|nr:hypothetical protein BDZ97DRAFT_1753171 [Flammula alnicola]